MFNKFNKIFKGFALVTVAAMLFAFAGCTGGGSSSKSEGSSSESEGSSSEKEEIKLIKDGKLVMGTSADFPPFEYKDGDGFAGIDVDIMEELAKRMNLELEIKDMSFESLDSAMSSKQVDIVVAGMTVTPAREKVYNFSDTYFKAKQTIIVKADSEIKSKEDLEDKIIGGQAGNVGLTEHAAKITDQGKIKAYNNGALAVEGLIAGDVDAVIIDDFPAQEYKKNNSDKIKLIEGEFVDEEYAIGVGKENKALAKELNKFIKEINDDGTYQKIRDKYIK